MSQNSKIEWTDATWNPIVGCQIVSPGCTNCYAMKMAARIQKMEAATGRATPYAGTTQHSKAGAVWTGKVALASEATPLKPLTWRKPRRIFVNSMSDIFAEGVPDEEVPCPDCEGQGAGTDWEGYQWECETCDGTGLVEP